MEDFPKIPISHMYPLDGFCFRSPSFAKRDKAIKNGKQAWSHQICEKYMRRPWGILQFGPETCGTCKSFFPRDEDAFDCLINIGPNRFAHPAIPAGFRPCANHEHKRASCFDNTIQEYITKYGPEHLVIRRPTFWRNMVKKQNEISYGSIAIYINDRMPAKPTHEKENKMSVNNAKKGDYLIVTEQKNPLSNTTVKVVDVLTAQRKGNNGDDDTYRVYKCTTEDNKPCMFSPTEVKRTKVTEMYTADGLVPLGKVRLYSSEFRNKCIPNGDPARNSGSEWYPLNAILDDGKLLGIKVGCNYLEVDALQEILDRLGEIGAGLASVDAKERMKD